MSRFFRFALNGFLVASLGYGLNAIAQADYNRALCVSNSKREELCSVTLTKKSILLKYASGRNESVKMHKIQEISSRDESKMRGFLFTRLDRKYVYAIDFLNVDNEAERVEVAFDSKELSKEFDSLLNSRK